MERYNALTEDFEEVTILDKPALFTPLRIDRSTVPHGYYLYEVRHDDDCSGDAVQIARNIYVNHWGSLITRDEIALPDGFLDIEPEDLNYGTGDCRSMRDFMAKYPQPERNVSTIIIVDAPEVSLAEYEKAGEALLKFYRGLGWNGEDILDPRKISTTKAVYNRLHDIMFSRCPDPVGVGMLMINNGPGTDNCVPPGKVYLLDGWIKPAKPGEGDETDELQQTV
jgi:hypothetical protein